MVFLIGLVLLIFILFAVGFSLIPALFIEIYRNSTGLIKLRNSNPHNESDFTTYSDGVKITKRKITYYDSYYHQNYNGIEIIFKNTNICRIELQFFSGTFFGEPIKSTYNIILRPGEIKKYQLDYTSHENDRVKITIL